MKAETPSIKLNAPKKPEINTDGLRSRPNALPDEPSVSSDAVPEFMEIKHVNLESNELMRVRHHTSSTSLKSIKQSGTINASRGSPYGVDVETAPFTSPAKVNLGQTGKGAYIEFSVPKGPLQNPPGYMGGTGNAGRIITNGIPLNIQNAKPTFKVWKWWDFFLYW